MFQHDSQRLQAQLLTCLSASKVLMPPKRTLIHQARLVFQSICRLPSLTILPASQDEGRNRSLAWYLKRQPRISVWRRAARLPLLDAPRLFVMPLAYPRYFPGLPRLSTGEARVKCHIQRIQPLFSNTPQIHIIGHQCRSTYQSVHGT